MLNIKEMQNNIINIFGFEHANTVDFMELCERFAICEELIYTEYERIIATKNIITNNYNCAHIHIFVLDGITDEVIKTVVVELNNKPFESYVDIVKDIERTVLDNAENKNNYISIHNIIVQ